MKLKVRKRCTHFLGSLLITLCVIGSASGLFVADYNTRTVAQGQPERLLWSDYRNQMLTVSWGDTVATITLPEGTDRVLRYLRMALPAPLQLWGVCAEELRGLWDFFEKK